MRIDKEVDKSGSEVPSIVFRLEPSSGVPTYLQLVHQVEHALRLGYLTQGDQLPRVKDVVASLSINLEQKGLIAGRPGQGTFVEVAPDTVGLRELTELRRNLVSGWLKDAATAGLDEQGTVALFMAALRDFRDRPLEARPARRGGRQRGEGAA